MSPRYAALSREAAPRSLDQPDPGRLAASVTITRVVTPQLHAQPSAVALRHPVG